MCLFLLAACEDKGKLPEGYEIVNNDGASHFVYVSEEHLGDKTNQRDAARVICNDIFKQPNYCEVYFFDNKEDIPTKFPIMNRLKPIGTYEIKSGKEKFSLLK